jgi:hypothetical protein
MLPSFGREPFKEVYQGFPLIYRFEVVWMDEFIFKPRNSSSVKALTIQSIIRRIRPECDCYLDDISAKYPNGRPDRLIPGRR